MPIDVLQELLKGFHFYCGVFRSGMGMGGVTVVILVFYHGNGERGLDR
jgi:hypothetical protein